MLQWPRFGCGEYLRSEIVIRDSVLNVIIVLRIFSASVRVDFACLVFPLMAKKVSSDLYSPIISYFGPRQKSTLGRQGLLASTTRAFGPQSQRLLTSPPHLYKPFFAFATAWSGTPFPFSSSHAMVSAVKNRSKGLTFNAAWRGDVRIWMRLRNT